jgi:hypothetical protein
VNRLSILSAADDERAASAADIISYALAKQLSAAHTLSGAYGDIALDDELVKAIDNAIRPILKRRLAAAGPAGEPA